MDRFILIVDSDNNLAGKLTAILAGAGYCVRSTTAEEAALYTIFQTPPELVLIDVAFLDGDGKRFTSVLRRLGRTMPVVAVFSSVGNGTAEPGLYGVAKPVNSVELLRTIASALAAWDGSYTNGTRPNPGTVVSRD